MMLLNDKLKTFKNSVINIEGISIYHYFHPKMNPPYLLWAEIGEADSLHTDDTKSEQSISIDVDYYTKTEFDSHIDEIQNAFNEYRFAWDLASVDFETETELIHYNWRVEI